MFGACVTVLIRGPFGTDASEPSDHDACRGAYFMFGKTSHILMYDMLIPVGRSMCLPVGGDELSGTEAVVKSTSDVSVSDVFSATTLS